MAIKRRGDYNIVRNSRAGMHHLGRMLFDDLRGRTIHAVFSIHDHAWIVFEPVGQTDKCHIHTIRSFPSKNTPTVGYEWREIVGEFNRDIQGCRLLWYHLMLVGGIPATHTEFMAIAQQETVVQQEKSNVP